MVTLLLQFKSQYRHSFDDVLARAALKLAQQQCSRRNLGGSSKKVTLNSSLENLESESTLGKKPISLHQLLPDWSFYCAFQTLWQLQNLKNQPREETLQFFISLSNHFRGFRSIFQFSHFLLARPHTPKTLQNEVVHTQCLKIVKNVSFEFLSFWCLQQFFKRFARSALRASLAPL